MAEGDSIARLAARMHARTAGALIVRSTFRHPRWATADLAGQRITGWHPRGKHLLMRTDEGWTLHSHLRRGECVQPVAGTMPSRGAGRSPRATSASWSVLRPGSRFPRDLRVGLGLEDGRTAAGVALPVVTLVRTRDEDRVVGHLGPDLLAEAPDLDDAAARLRAEPGRPAVVALLDQRNVAGLGNMWAQELLFLQRTSPWRPIGSVDLPPLLARARELLREAVAVNHGQVTTGDTRPGRRHFVYGRKGRPCLHCGTPVAFRPAGGRVRETWWCPRCQAE